MFSCIYLLWSVDCVCICMFTHGRQLKKKSFAEMKTSNEEKRCGSAFALNARKFAELWSVNDGGAVRLAFVNVFGIGDDDDDDGYDV